MSRQLDPADAEAIAERVVEMLGERTAPSKLVSAAELSRRLGLSRSTVYEKADELGVIRIGRGPRARLRFDLNLVAERLETGKQRMSPSTSPQRAAVRRRHATRTAARPGLLPIRGPVPR